MMMTILLGVYEYGFRVARMYCNRIVRETNQEADKFSQRASDVNDLFVLLSRQHDSLQPAIAREIPWAVNAIDVNDPVLGRATTMDLVGEILDRFSAVDPDTPAGRAVSALRTWQPRASCPHRACGEVERVIHRGGPFS